MTIATEQRMKRTVQVLGKYCRPNIFACAVVMIVTGCDASRIDQIEQRVEVLEDNSDLVVRVDRKNRHGQWVLGEQNGVFAVDDPSEGRLYLNSDGSKSGSGVWKAELSFGYVESQYEDGRKNGLERHVSQDFVRLSRYKDGLKHGTEIIVNRDSAGDVSQWKELEFKDGKPVGKMQFHLPEIDGPPPDIETVMIEANN